MEHIKYRAALIVSIFVLIGVNFLFRVNDNVSAQNTLTGVNEVVSIADTTDGLPLNAVLTIRDISSDGNVVLFETSATNVNGSGRLYTYDIRGGVTNSVVIAADGSSANSGVFNTEYRSRISESGRYVMFGSTATNLLSVTSPSPGAYYKRDMTTGTTSRIGGGFYQFNSSNWDRNIAFSNDGRFVLLASRYIQGTYPNPYGIILGEDISGIYSWKVLDRGGSPVNSAINDNVVGDMSCDGAFAVYKAGTVILVADLRSGTVVKSLAGDSDSISPIMSCNGRYVLYSTTNRTQITPGPTGMNNNYHLVRYDRLSDTRSYVNTSASGMINSGYTYSTNQSAPTNIANASVSDSGDVVFNYGGNMHLKHFSDNSDDIEPVGKKIDGTTITVDSALITDDGRYIYFYLDPFDLGIGSSAQGKQIIRTKTGL